MSTYDRNGVCLLCHLGRNDHEANGDCPKRVSMTFRRADISLREAGEVAYFKDGEDLARWVRDACELLEKRLPDDETARKLVARAGR